MCLENRDQADNGGLPASRWRRLMANRYEGALAVDASAKVVFADPLAAGICGVEPGNLVGHCLSELFDGDAWPALWEQARLQRAGRTGWSAMTFRHPATGRRQLRASIIPGHDSDGVFTGGCVLLRDAAPPEAAAAALDGTRSEPEPQPAEFLALRESEARYRMLAAMTSDYAASILVAEDGSLTTEWVVGSYEEITGYGVQFNQPARLDSTHPDDLERQRRDVAETLRNQQTTTEFRTLKPDGAVVWLRIARNPIWDEQQQRVVRFITVAQDITKRKQAEQALADSESRYKLLSSMTLDYAALLRVEPDGRLTTEWAVGSYEEIAGVAIRPGRTAKLMSTHPDDLERQKRDIARTLQNEPTVTEFRTLKRDGSKVWLRISRRPNWDAEQQRVTSFLVVAQDITERKLAEEELRRSQVLQAELEAIHKTVATLAHAINNPLTGIIATLQMGVEPDIDKAELDEMLVAALSAARTIRDVVAKIQTIRQPSYRPYLDDRKIIDTRAAAEPGPD